jgi:hypothetical protein
MFVTDKGEVTGQVITLHNKELSDLYRSPCTVRVLKARRLRWAGWSLTRMGETKNAYNMLVAKPLGNERFKALYGER